jgi:hypothetical protein
MEAHVLSIALELLGYALAIAGVGWLFHTPALSALAAAAVALHIARALDGVPVRTGTWRRLVDAVKQRVKPRSQDDEL